MIACDVTFASFKSKAASENIQRRKSMIPPKKFWC